jgi:hypothetical protein
MPSDDELRTAIRTMTDFVTATNTNLMASQAKVPLPDGQVTKFIVVCGTGRVGEVLLEVVGELQRNVDSEFSGSKVLAPYGTN